MIRDKKEFLAFQSPIGTQKTCPPLSSALAETQISIPYRYTKNRTHFKLCALHKYKFQSPIGTQKTCNVPMHLKLNTLNFNPL